MCQVRRALQQGPFNVRQLAGWQIHFPADLVVWQKGNFEAAAVLLATVLGVCGSQ
jgi:hypothetical protein